MKDGCATLSRTCARALLERLGDLGIDYLFGNPGSEFPLLIEAYTQGGGVFPTAVTVAHEPIAVHMAYGYYLRTGRPQAVMVHATVGAANSALALMNASRMRIPILFLAGRTPITESRRTGSRDKFIHWAQESFDQGGMLREYVKWDYELRDATMVGEVLDRALAIAMSPPRGPVYLMLPREVLCAEVGAPVDGCNPNVRAQTKAAPEPAQVSVLARSLVASARPLILTKTIGENPAAVRVLARLAERFQIPVATPDAHYMNLPRDHPWFCGYEVPEAIGEADTVLVLDMDVPWIPSRRGPDARALIFHMGEEPLFPRIPHRGHRGDLFLLSDVELGLLAIEREMDALRPGEPRPGSREQWRDTLAGGPPPGTMDARNRIIARDVAHALGESWRCDMVLVNELGLPPAPLPLTEPRSYFRTGSASGLGWGLAASLGVKLASPEATVIAVVGDGAYFLANPLAVHWQAQENRLPCLTVVLNNGGMKSIAHEVERVHSHGFAVSRNEFPFTRFDEPPPYEEIVRCFGGHGERVDEPRALHAAIGRGLQAVQHAGKQALLNVLLK